MTDRNIAAETIKEQKIQPTLFQIIKYKLSQSKELKQFTSRLGAAIGSCFLGSYMVVNQKYRVDHNKKYRGGVIARLKSTLFSTYFIQTSISFSSKVLADLIWPYEQNQYSQYIKGIMVGIISYKLNTPLKNIEIFQSKISKKISKRTAYQFIKERYDIGTLYRGSSIINSMLFFSLYFGVYHTLNSSYGDVPYRYLFNPLLASLAACLPINIINIVINIVKNTYHGRQQMRQFDAFVRGKRVLYKQKELTRLKETILVGGGLFSMSYHQKRIFLFEFMSHWLMLSLFGLLQNELFASSNPTFFSFAERINKLMTSDPHKIFQ